MKKLFKKIVIIYSIILICLISTSFVCANENLTDDTGLLNAEEMSNEIIQSSDEGNFTELSQLISNTDSSLELDKDYKYVSGDNVANTGIAISKSITINGNGHTIDASNLVRIFSISGSNVILKNLTLINGKYSGYGGAISVSGTNFTLDNCKLEDNYANYGGAIYSTGTNTKITNSELKSNTAQYSGGAIRSTNSNLVIENSTFANNQNKVYSAYYGGGAVYSTGSRANILNSKFENNSARYNGGAVYLDGSYSTINNSTFINSTAKDSAAVYMGGSYSNVNNSKFYNNSATEYDGGAIGWYGNYGKVTNSYFENNTANNHGGGVFWHYNYGTMDNLTFVNNHAANGAGISVISTAYMNDDSNSHTVIQNSRFINNTALYGAAGVDASSHAKIVNSTFTSNKAGNYGGAVTLTNAELINSTLTNNTAIYGGAVYSYNSNIENTTFTGNEALNGNSIYILDKSTLNNNKNLDESDITVYDSENERGNVIDNDYNIDNLITTTNGYMAYCAERYNTNPYSGVFDNRMVLLRNSINNQPVGEYLKIMIYEFLENMTDLKDYDFANYVWAFTDNEYWNSDDPIVKEVIRLYDSGFRVPTEHACKVLPNGTIMYFNFSSLITGTGQQNLFLFKFDYGDKLNQTMTKESLNKTGIVNDTIQFRIVMSNKGNSTLYDLFVEDEDYSNGLKYADWQSEIGNWTYNATTKKWRLDELQPAKSASIILTFKAMVNGTLVNNATGGIGKTVTSNATNSTRIYKPDASVEKITLNKTVEIGDEVVFEIIVKNTGDMDLTNISIIEDKYDDGLVYLRFKSTEGTWEEHLNNESKHEFALKTTLKVGETAKFQVIFKATKTGELKNTIVGINRTSTNSTTVINSTTSNDTKNSTNLNKTTSNDTKNSTKDFNTSNHTKVDEKKSIAKVDGKATGNPLLMLILTLIVLPIGRKLKK